MLLSGIPFAALSVGLFIWVDEETAKRLAPALVGLTMALAVFAINFSFVAFQLAPYRHLHQGPSRRHLTASVMLVVLALAPLLGSFCGTASTGELAAAATPILAFSAVFLVAFALREAEPDQILASQASDSALESFAKRFGFAVRQQVKELKRLDFEADLPRDERLPPPMHEIFHRVPPPPLRNDPLDVCVRAAEAALGNDDATVFTPAVERLIAIAMELRTHPFATSQEVEGSQLATAAEMHGAAAIDRVIELLNTAEGRASLADRFIEIVARHVRESGFEGRATSEEVGKLFMAGVAVAEAQIEKGRSSTGVIGLLVAARMVTDQTLRALNEKEEPLEEYSLAIYPSGVQELGEAAIDSRKSELLYRCLETLSWIGCSAVRDDGSETGRRAAEGLVQLGRLARHIKLECHWARCTLTPHQHARERLQWMVTWIPKSHERERWLESLGTAFSRLDGYERSLRLEESDTPKITLVMPEDAEPHTESFFAEGGERTLDYSDEAMLKDQVLR